MLNIIAVGLGASGGAVLRALAAKIAKPSFLGTLIVNLIGSFLLGTMSTFLVNQHFTYALLGIGFCGGLTTFSTFNYELLQMLKNKQYLRFLVYAVATYALSLICLLIGIYLSK